MRILKSLSSRQEAPVTTGDMNLHHFPWDDFEGGRGRIYDPDFVPPGGWDKFNEWAASQGKIAHIIQSRAKNAMAFQLVSDDEKIQKDLETTFRKLHFNTQAIDWFATRDTYGRVFIEPVWTVVLNGGLKIGLKKIKSLYPRSIKVFFDNENDVKALKEYLKYKKEYRDYGEKLEEGAGDTVIGFVQYWERKDKLAYKDKSIFFLPDELIMILRHPSHLHPLGLSLPRQNHDLIMNKLGIEKDQAIMAKRHGDPKHKFVIPYDQWDSREEIKGELKKGIRSGLDFFFKGRRTNDSDRMDVTLVEPAGNPTAVIKAQSHTEDQFNAAMGWADSFTESTSSNRSVGYIQLCFFERNLEPERRIFEEVLLDQLIEPWLQAKSYPAGSVKFKWTDLTPEDRLQKAQVMAPLIPYMPASIIKQFLEELGYQLE